MRKQKIISWLVKKKFLKLLQSFHIVWYTVTSSAKEPVVGWIDNLYGPTGVVAGVGTGILRTLHCGHNINANIVPVDYTVNALIAAVWDVAQAYEKT